MNTVPVLSMVFMGISALISVLIPVSLLIWLRRKGADIIPFFVGCLTFVLFALVLESLVHQVVLTSSAGAVIQGNIFLYALYGGVMAALFEECGRFLAFRFPLRKYSGNDRNALMYGAGHGGIESMVILGGSMISNLVYASMVNRGTIGDLLAALDPAQQQQLSGVINSMISSPSYIFLLGSVERILAVILHICLSVFVFYAVKRKEPKLFLLALLVHFLVDAVTVILSSVISSAILIEICLAFMVAIVAYIARKVYREAKENANH